MNQANQSSLFSSVDNIIRPAWEIASYESLWEKYPTVKKIADLFRQHDYKLPSQVAKFVGILDEQVEILKREINELFAFKCYSAIFHGDFNYPEKLRQAEHPSEIVYYQGDLDLIYSNIVSVVGARKATPEGIKRSKKIAKLLAKNNFTVMSGLAEGIDTADHTETIESGGKTVAVLGTPLNEFYPKANKDLQKRIAEDHLLLSQVPFYMSSKKSNWKLKPLFFPERNITMSALSLATIIVEASDTSGSLIQARAAINQNRKLFILKSCFDKGLLWPEKYLKKGAIKVSDEHELIDVMGNLSKN